MGVWRRFNETVTIEPTIFFFFLGVTITVQSWPQTLYTKFCWSDQRNLTLCSNGTWEEAHPALQAKTSIWTIYSNITTFIPALIGVTLLSGYSDRHGLLPALLLPHITTMISSIWTIIQVVFLDWDASLMLLSSFASGCGGYFTLVFSGCVTYLTRDPYVRNVGTRIAVLEAVRTAAEGIGALIIGPILDSPNGLIKAWSLCLALSVIVILDILFRLRRLPDPPNISLDSQSRKGCCSVLKTCCNLDTIKSYLHVVSKKRSYGRRLHIHVVTAAVMIGYLAIIGVIDIQFLYITKEYGRTNTTYSIWNGIICASSFLGTIVLGYVFTAIYPIADMTFCIIGVVGNTVSFALLVYAQHPVFFWVSAILRVFNNYPIIGGRLYITHNMDKNEQASGFGYYATIQTLVTIFASVIFNYIYPQTLAYWPGLCFAVAAGLTVLTGPFFTLVRYKDIKNGLDSLSVRRVDGSEVAVEYHK